MAAKLKDYFPMIRERKEVLSEIRKSRALDKKFKSWTKEKQDEFLNLCTGVKGLKLLYDGFFKEVMSPEYAPERLGDFLSCMLKQKLKVIKALPADSARLANESALLAMDLVVELEDGSMANVEMQRIGYILEMELLQKYLFIPLDIFRENQQNRDKRNKRDAWLELFSSDDPDMIAELLEDYPEFRDIYREGYQICLNIEKVMGMFSEELYILDRNTEKYMFDEMQRELDGTRNDLNAARSDLAEVRNDLAETQNDLAEAQNDLARLNDKYRQAIKKTAEILRSIGLSDPEIMDKLCSQYQLEKAQAEEYVKTCREGEEKCQ